MGFDTINKIFLIYEKAWWTENIQGYQLIWPTDKISCFEQEVWQFYTFLKIFSFENIQK